MKVKDVATKIVVIIKQLQDKYIPHIQSDRFQISGQRRNVKSV